MQASETLQARRQQAADLLVKTAAPAADPLSTLRALLEQLGTRCTEMLCELGPVPMELTLRDLVSRSAEGAVAAYGAAGIVGVFNAGDRGAPVLIGADGAFANAALEAVLGSDGSEPASDVERPPTRVAMRLASTIFEQVAGAVRLAVFGADAPPLALDRVEPAAELAVPPQRDEDCVLATFVLTTLERTGEMFVALPQSAVQGAKPAAAAAGPAGTATRDPDWSKRIEQEVQRTQVTLQAVLDERELTLGEIAELQIGQVLPLKASPRSNVKVICNDQTLFWCELGQTEGVYTLRIKEYPNEEQELIDVITSQ